MRGSRGGAQGLVSAGPCCGTASVETEPAKRIHNSRPTLGSTVDTAQRSLHTGPAMGGQEAVGALLSAMKGGVRWQPLVGKAGR
jgi:hypothetical protein